MERLSGLNILLVEDEAFIALDVDHVLSTAACNVLGPYANVAATLRAIDQAERIDCGILDLNLGNEHTLSVADALSARSVPFVWVSGYDRQMLPERYRDHPFIAKPFLKDDLLNAVSDAFAGKTSTTQHGA